MRITLLTSVAVAACALAAGLGSEASAAARARTPGLALKAAAAPRSELVHTGSVAYRGLRVDRFQQRVDGYPVIGGEATVVEGRGGSARLAADATSTAAAKSDLAAPTP